MISRSLPCLLFVLALPLQAATIYVDSTKTGGGDDGTSCADAFLTIAQALSAWTTSDVIYVSTLHAETSASSLNLTSSNDTAAVPIEVRSVNCSASDVYTKATSAQITRTGSALINSTELQATFHGIYFKSAQDIFAGGSSGSSLKYVDSTWELSGTASSDNLNIGSNSSFQFDVEYHDHTFGCSSSTDCRLYITGAGKYTIYGGTVTGDYGSAGVFRGQNLKAGPDVWMYGVDFGGLGNETIFDMSSMTTVRDFHCVGCEFPAIFTLHDSGFVGDYHFLHMWGTDDAGEAFQQEQHGFRGSITTSTSVYHDAGLQFTEGDTRASLKLAPASNVLEHRPLCTWQYARGWIDTTGSKTFTTEIAENYTTALNQSDLWQRIYYLGTSGETLISIDNPAGEIGGSTALAAGTGCANWTGEPATCRSSKLETTVTINKIGLYAAQVCVGTFESGKVVHIDKPTVS